MADSERIETGGRDAVDAPPQREELDQLLQRIAAHIDEVGKAAVQQEVEASGKASAPAAPDATGGNASDVPLVTPHQPDVMHDVPHSPSEAGGSRHDAIAHGTDEPWDAEAAEALTRSYEADAATGPLRNVLGYMAQQQAGMGTADPRGSRPMSSHAVATYGASDVDAAQTRLIEAARRVETMLDRLAPRDAVEALGDRFQALEGEVRRSNDNLARLDAVETRLGELGQKLTDEQIYNLFGSLVPTAEDLTHFAEDAAGRAAERVLEAYAREIAPEQGATPGAAAVMSPGMDSQLTSLGDVLGAFMEERRRTDASTIEALETLQLAMQHVLDRIDRTGGQDISEPALHSDAGSPNAHAPHLAHLPSGPTLVPSQAPPQIYPMQNHGSGLVEANAVAHDEPSEGIVNLTANQVVGAPDLSAESYSMPPSAGRHGEPPRMPQAAIDVLPPGLRKTDRPGEVSPGMTMPQQPMPADADAMPAEEAPQNDRQALIAMARKAAERAKAGSEKPAKGQPDAPRAEKVAKRSIFGADASNGIIRPGVLLVAIAAIAFAGYLLLFGQNGLLRTTAAIDAEATQPVASAMVTGVHAGATSVPSKAVADAVAPAATHDAGTGSVNVASAVEGQPTTSASDSEAHGPGMAISFTDSPATFDTVAKARQRAHMASLSQKAAFSAADQNRAAAVPTPAVAAPAAHPGKTIAIETSSVSAVQDVRQLGLPPATSGPLSLRLAAAKGDPGAQLEIATRFAEGKGIRQNFAEAARWYERSAARGNAVAQYRLATLYERGMGVKADREKARALYMKAAEAGNLKAMHNLAVIAASPAAGTPDYITAARLFSRAAQHGLHDSQYNLGVLYESGLGVAKDHATAYKWYSLAARSGDTVAARRRDMLIAKLPPETIQAMDARIARWQAAPADQATNDVRLASSISG